MLRPILCCAAATLVAAYATLAGAGENTGWEIDPGSSPYDDYLADPRAPRMRFGLGVASKDIPDTTAGRVFLDAGTRYTLARFIPESPEAEPIWIDVEGAVFMQFDAGNSFDNLGWDGRFGILAVRELDPRLTVRGGFRHFSSHVGDEFIERTGRTRVSYRRDDIVFGASFKPQPRLTTYVETSVAFSVGNPERQDHLMVDLGAQYLWPRSRQSNTLTTSRYAALHVQTNQETDWEPGVTAKLGWALQGAAQTTQRYEVEAYTGRALLGEFALDFDETYLMVSFGIDFAAVPF